MINPTVVLTGATRNIGFATAERFAKAGYNIVITSRDKSSAEKAASKISEKYPVCALGVGMDPKEPQQIADAFKLVDDMFGRVDVLVCNATRISTWKSVLEETPEGLNGMMQSNVLGYFFCAQEAAKIMKRNGGGNIVMISSVQGYRAVPKMAAYAASKSAINSISRTFAVELAKYNIRCNTIVCGGVRSERWAAFTEEEIERKRDNWPLGKEAEPEDIASAVFYLSSDEAKMITGIEFAVDSGVTACLLKYNKHWDE